MDNFSVEVNFVIKSSESMNLEDFIQNERFGGLLELEPVGDSGNVVRLKGLMTWDQYIWFQKEASNSWWSESSLYSASCCKLSVTTSIAGISEEDIKGMLDDSGEKFSSDIYWQRRGYPLSLESLGKTSDSDVELLNVSVTTGFRSARYGVPFMGSNKRDCEELERFSSFLFNRFLEKHQEARLAARELVA